MANSFKLLQWLFNRRKRSIFPVKKGQTAIILKNQADYLHLIDGLSDASYWTGINYNKILTDPQTQIIKN